MSNIQEKEKIQDTRKIYFLKINAVVWVFWKTNSKTEIHIRMELTRSWNKDIWRLKAA